MALWVPDVHWWDETDAADTEDLLTKQRRLIDGRRRRVVMHSAQMWEVTPFSDEGSLKLTTPRKGTVLCTGRLLDPRRDISA